MFTKKDLKNGMFVVAYDDIYGVIVDDCIVYEDGGFDMLLQLDNNLKFKASNKEIKYVVNAISFNNAKCYVENYDTEHILYDYHEKFAIDNNEIIQFMKNLEKKYNCIITGKVDLDFGNTNWIMEF